MQTRISSIISLRRVPLKKMAVNRLSSGMALKLDAAPAMSTRARIIWRIKSEYAKLSPMARRPDRGEEDVLSEKDLKELRHNLAHLSAPAVLAFTSKPIGLAAWFIGVFQAPRRSRHSCRCGSSSGSGVDWGPKVAEMVSLNPRHRHPFGLIGDESGWKSRRAMWTYFRLARPQLTEASSAMIFCTTSPIACCTSAEISVPGPNRRPSIP